MREGEKGKSGSVETSHAVALPLQTIDPQYISPCSPIPSCPSRGGTGYDPVVSSLAELAVEIRTRSTCSPDGRQTYRVGDCPMPLKLAPDKPQRLGARCRIIDSPRGADDGPVEGEGPCAEEELFGSVNCRRSSRLGGRGSGNGTDMIQAHGCAEARPGWAGGVAANGVPQ